VPRPLDRVAEVRPADPVARLEPPVRPDPPDDEREPLPAARLRLLRGGTLGRITSGDSSL
jgi:hypothetical protein